MINKVFPRQKLSYTQKGEKWGKECIEGAFELACNADTRIRQSYFNKKKNYDLWNDVIDMNDVHKVISPAGLKMNTFPATMQNYPLCNPKLKLLIGEELKRRFEWKIICTNPDNFTIKEEQMTQSYMQYINEVITQSDADQETIKRRLAEIQKYYKYDYQDIREKISSDIMSYYYQEQEMARKFNEGFQDALICADEIYRIDVVAGEPKLIKCDPLRIWVYGNGLSPHIDDADIIVEDVYLSVGQVIDEFYEELTDAEIRELEENSNYMNGRTDAGLPGQVNYNFRVPTIYTTAFTDDKPYSWDNSRYRTSSGEYFDGQGNVRVIRSTWKSKRKIGKLKYYDENGQPFETIVDENYNINKQKGEEITWMWVNEYWEGVRIGKDIYKRIRPKEVQFNSINNLSYCSSGYIGTSYNTNSSKARSLFDQIKPFQYLYNIYMYRTELAFAKYKGPMLMMPTSLIPNGWDMEKWMTYAEALGYLIVNPFNEINEGAFKGDMAFQANTLVPQIISDDSVANFINSNIQMLAYIEEQVGNISGVSKQRQGQVETKELVGNVERAVTQSSHITEPWFATHENTKLRAMQTFLEAAKFCMKYKTDKRYYHILDEASIRALESDPSLVADSDLALFVTSSSKYIEFEQAIKQLAHAAMQNQMIGFKEIIDIYQATSITQMSKIMENAEELKRQQQEAMEKAQRDHEMQMLQLQQQIQEKQLEQEVAAREDQQMHDLAMIKIQAEEDRKTKMLEAQLTNDPALQQAEISLKAQELQAKLALQKDKQDKDNKVKEQDSKANQDFNKGKLQLEKEAQAKEDQRANEKLKVEIEVLKEKLKLAKDQVNKDHQIKKSEHETSKQTSKEELKLEKESHNKDHSRKDQELENKLQVEREKLKLEKEKMEKELKQMEKEGQLEIQLMKEEHALELELKKHEQSIKKDVADVKGEEAKKQAKIKTKQSNKPNNKSK